MAWEEKSFLFILLWIELWPYSQEATLLFLPPPLPLKSTEKNQNLLSVDANNFQSM